MSNLLRCLCYISFKNKLKIEIKYLVDKIKVIYEKNKNNNKSIEKVIYEEKKKQ